jgi:hypothetical protein
MQRICLVAGLALTIVLSISCGARNPEPVDTSITNVELGISLAAIPDGLVVAENQGAILRLQPEGEGAAGTLWFEVGPEQEGVNLVAAVKAHQAAVEGLANGDYKGGQELQGDFGSAFYSRGRYLENNSLIEETVLFMVHPAGNRLLAAHYRYPAGDDSAARVEQLIDVVSYLE